MTFNATSTRRNDATIVNRVAETLRFRERFIITNVHPGLFVGTALPLVRAVWVTRYHTGSQREGILVVDRHRLFVGRHRHIDTGDHGQLGLSTDGLTVADHCRTANVVDTRSSRSVREVLIRCIGNCYPRLRIVRSCSSLPLIFNVIGIGFLSVNCSGSWIQRELNGFTCTGLLIESQTSCLGNAGNTHCELTIQGHRTSCQVNVYGVLTCILRLSFEFELTTSLCRPIRQVPEIGCTREFTG